MLTRGHMYEQQIPPLIAFIFYLLFKLKKISMYEPQLGLSSQPKLCTHFSMFKQPKCWIKMAAQSYTCLTDANAEKELNF